MPNIRQLDDITINRIAAGEVIDRPASVVKELIENSLDAKSTRIQIVLEDGGKRLIRITDNGSGIAKDDLILAPLQHTTSKIDQFEDIYQTASMGFRGEALASICHVAKLIISSKTKNNDAHKITADPDISQPTPCNHTDGTTIEVQQLFSRIPVRRKYLKTTATEYGYCFDMIQRFAILYPDIDFVLTHNQQETINTTDMRDLNTLLIHFFGKHLKGHLINIDSHQGQLSAQGFISDPTVTFPNRTRQIVAINHRFIKNALVQKVIQDAFADTIPSKRFPLVALNITLPFQDIDINIHPQKTDIKFLESHLLFDQLKKIIRSVLTAEHQIIKLKDQDPIHMLKSTTYQKMPKPADSPLFSLNSNPQNISTSIPKKPLLDTLLQNENSDSPTIYSTAPQQTSNPTKQSSPISTKNVSFFQMFQTYLIIKGYDALWLIDQHAAHERILYEQIKSNHQDAQAKQMLLIAEIIDLTPAQAQFVPTILQIFAKLHFEIEEFGANQLAIRQIPASFLGMSVIPFAKDILCQIEQDPELTKTTDPTYDIDKFKQMACKAAIKAGKTMTKEETNHLIRDFLESPANFTCPHGRPLFIKMDQTALEKLFKR